MTILYNYCSLGKNFFMIYIHVYTCMALVRVGTCVCYVVGTCVCYVCHLNATKSFFTFWNKSCHCVPELQSLRPVIYRHWGETRQSRPSCTSVLQKTSNQMKMDFLRFIVTTQLIMHDRDIYWARFTRTPLSNWTNPVIVPLQVGQLLSGELISVWQTRIASWLHPSLLK